MELHLDAAKEGIWVAMGWLMTKKLELLSVEKKVEQ